MPHFDGRRFKIDYVEEGKGPCIVFAHDVGMDHTMFAAQFEDLPDLYRCIALDMRGHGRSQAPPPPWSMQEVVVDLVAFIEQVGAAPCHLVGASWGGIVALRTAIQREDLLRSLVVMGTSADAEDPEWAQLYRTYEVAVADEDGVSEELARQTIPMFFADPFVQRAPEAIEVHVDRLTKMGSTAVIEALRMLNDREPMIDRLDEVRVPTLVIHGELDASVGMAHAEAIASGVKGAELVKVAEAGHTPSIECPDVVNEALAGFFARVKR